MRLTLLLGSALLLLLAAACNPAARCSKATECPEGSTCSGGFCADYHVPGGRGEATDGDGPDSGVHDGGTFPDGGPLDDGR